MKILCFTDSHGNKEYNKDMLKQSKNVDAIICAGDFTWFEDSMEDMLDYFDSLGKPFLIVPGNHENPVDLARLCKGRENIMFVHRKSVNIGDVTFAGYGGEGFTSETLDAEDFFKSLKFKFDKKVLIFHAPPYNVSLDLINGSHVGNKSFRRIIKQVKPKYAICGHMHENECMHDMLGNTIVLNPGPHGIIIEI